MKARVYLRIAKTKRGTSVHADTKPSYSALENSMGEPYPTIRIVLDLDIADNEFEASRILLEAKISETKPCVEIKQVKL